MIAPKKKPVKKSPSKERSVSKKALVDSQQIDLVSTPVLSEAPVIKKLNIPATMASAIDLHQKGQLRESYLTCELIVRTDSKHAGAFHLMGVIAIENRDFPLAMRMLSESLSIDPDNFLAHNNLGVVYRILKDSLAAAAHFEKAVSLKPDYAEAFNNLGVVLRELNRPEDALAQFKTALKIKPDYEDAKNNQDSILSSIQARKN